MLLNNCILQNNIYVVTILGDKELRSKQQQVMGFFVELKIDYSEDV
jgi:hypothetical protein